MSINHNTEQILTQHNPLFYLDGYVVMPSQAAHECVRLGFSSQDKKLFLETMPGVINTDVNHLNLKWKPMFLFEIERETEREREFLGKIKFRQGYAYIEIGEQKASDIKYSRLVRLQKTSS